MQMLRFTNGVPQTREVHGLLESFNMIDLLEDNKSNIWVNEDLDACNQDDTISNLPIKKE